MKDDELQNLYNEILKDYLRSKLRPKEVKVSKMSKWDLVKIIVSVWIGTFFGWGTLYLVVR
jgi:hypothetical protein